MARKERIDMTGRRFERLVGIEFSHKDRHGHCHWLFACDCGNEIVAHGGNVRSGGTTSCGCRHSEISAARLLRHGERARKRHGPTYRAWQTMKSICTNAKVTGYPRCGGRGIGVDDRWANDFIAFLDDMGERPAGMSLRRVDESLGFSPGNCRWVSVAPTADRAASAWQERRKVTRDPGPALSPPSRVRSTNPTKASSATVNAMHGSIA